MRPCRQVTAKSRRHVVARLKRDAAAKTSPTDLTSIKSSPLLTQIPRLALTVGAHLAQSNCARAHTRIAHPSRAYTHLIWLHGSINIFDTKRHGMQDELSLQDSALQRN